MIYTSDYVLDETFTLLFRRTPFEVAAEAMEKINEATQSGYLFLERINHDRFEKAKRMRLKYKDKPLISFTDLTSMAIMKEQGISRVLTDDEHFLHLGMDFIKVP